MGGILLGGSSRNDAGVLPFVGLNFRR